MVRPACCPRAVMFRQLTQRHRLYPTEINALEMRTKGASLAMATNWICVSFSSPSTPLTCLPWRFITDKQVHADQVFLRIMPSSKPHYQAFRICGGASGSCGR